MHVGQWIGQAARREDPGRHRLFQKRRERSARAVMVPKTPGEKPPGPTLSQAQAGAGPGGALAFGKFSDSARRALGKNVRRRGPPRVKSRKLRSGEQPPAGQTTASVSEGQPSHQVGQPPPPPLCGAAATSMAVDRRWALGGSAEVGPAPMWRAAPRARAPRPSAPRQRLSAAPVSSMVRVGGVGSGEWGQQGARARGGQQQGPTPQGSRRPTINPSLRKIAPRRAAQPLNIRTRAGVWGLAPTRSSAAGENWPKMAKKQLGFLGFWAFFCRIFSANATAEPYSATAAYERG